MLRNRPTSHPFLVILLLVNFFWLTNCIQRPQVAEGTMTSSSQFQHAEKMTSCRACHIPDRPAPTRGYVHYNNQDCVTCHFPTRWSEHSWHFRNPAQPTCIHCHHKDQPVSAQGTTHYNNQDCLLCHKAALTPGITWASLKTPTVTATGTGTTTTTATGAAAAPK